MPNAMADQIADEVTSDLDAATLTQSFTPTRKTVPREKLESLTGLVVTVVPRSIGWELLTRGKDWESHGIDIAVQAKVADKEPATLAPYQRLTEEIAKLFRRVVLDCGAAWSGSQIEPIYDPDHLEQLGVFTSVVRLTFKVATS